MNNKYDILLKDYESQKYKHIKDIVTESVLIVIFVILYFVITNWFKYVFLIWSIFKLIDVFIHLYNLNKVNKLIKKIIYLQYNANTNDIFNRFYEQFQKQNYQKTYDEYYSNTNTTTITVNNKYDNALKLFKINNNTPIDEIKKIYKELAIKWHPDKWVNDTIDNQKIAERNFKKLQSAYDIIKKHKNIK